MKNTKLIKSFIFAGVTLIVYSIVVRIFNIYFFWESSVLGGFTLWVGLFILMISLRGKRKAEGKSNGGVNFVIGLLIFTISVSIGFYVTLPFTNAYTKVQHYVLEEGSLDKELGEVQSMVILPMGSYNVATSGGVTHTSAVISCIIKGADKYADKTFILVLDDDTDEWEVHYVD